MGVAVCLSGLDHRQFVRVSSDIRKIIRNQESTLSAGLERPPVRSQVADTSAAGVDVFFILGQRLAGVLLQFRLVVERVHLAWTAVHHEEDAALGLTEVTRSARRQWI